MLALENVENKDTTILKMQDEPGKLYRCFIGMVVREKLRKVCKQMNSKTEVYIVKRPSIKSTKNPGNAYHDADVYVK